jgi:2-succinyl-5-enolpyruvyl-6-hydroxy-3-cyclohexene-1-carboxylate synthase
LVQAGVRDVVISPGSRNAPLIFAAEDLRRRGRVRTWVKLDERSAGFMALGLSLANPASPAVVITTSGTAAVNLHPAMVEAAYAGVALIALSADRPAELHGVGANQTIEQRGLFGCARLFVNLEAADGAAGLAKWSDAGFGAVAAARGRWAAWPGPVHVNLRFREPLAPASVALDDGPAFLGGAPGSHLAPDLPSVGLPVSGLGKPGVLRRGPRTVVVAGAGAGAAARELAESGRWPLLAEPSSGSWFGPAAVPSYRQVVAGPLGREVERVIVVGRPTLSREVIGLATRADTQLVVLHPGAGPWFDPGRRAQLVADRLRVEGAADGAEKAWFESWQAAGAAELVLRAADGRLTGQEVARCAAESCAGLGLGLMAAASGTIRDLDLVRAPRTPVRVFSSRGAAGIDGTVSTACGLALGLGVPVRALVGDLAFLHDSGGLATGETEDSADVDVIVLNNRGGGIFAGLEHAKAAAPAVFERYFTTPQRVDIGALARAYGTGYSRVNEPAQLEELLAVRPDGMRVIEAMIVPAAGEPAE